MDTGIAVYLNEIWDGTIRDLFGVARLEPAQRQAALNELLARTLRDWRQEGEFHNVYAELVERLADAGARRIALADTPCPKCGGTGVFAWRGLYGDRLTGTCRDCAGGGLVTAQQAEFRMAHVPRVVLERGH